MPKNLNLPVLLVELLEKFLKDNKKPLNETVSQAICREIGVDWETVKAQNEIRYPKTDPRLLTAGVVSGA